MRHRDAPNPDATPFGFLVLDKPAGLTSHQCVSRVRRAYGLKRVGHGGTLDPGVTGVLPLALGPATRLLPYLCGDKTYRGVVQLGVSTTTDDLDGEVLHRSSLPGAVLERDALEAALGAFRGPIQQVPPQVSAVHVDGVRAYARARRGETMELAARPVIIHHLSLLAVDPDRGQLQLEVRCSAGTYIRALARDLGAALGTGGALASLRRTGALGFDLNDAVPWEALDPQALAAGAPLPTLRSPLAALSHLAQQQLDDGELEGWRCGRPLQARQAWPQGTAVVVTTAAGELAGMANASADGSLQPKLVLDAAG